MACGVKEKMHVAGAKETTPLHFTSNPPNPNPLDELIGPLLPDSKSRCEGGLSIKIGDMARLEALLAVNETADG